MKKTLHLFGAKTLTKLALYAIMIKTREKDLKDASHSYQGAGNTEVRCRTCSDMNILARIGCFVKIFSQKNRAINRTSQKKREKRHISFEMCLFSFVL